MVSIGGNVGLNALDFCKIRDFCKIICVKGKIFKLNWKSILLSEALTQPEFTCSKSAIGTPEQCVKSVKNNVTRMISMMSFWCLYC